jgi:hypothetical protein
MADTLTGRSTRNTYTEKPSTTGASFGGSLINVQRLSNDPLRQRLTLGSFDTRKIGLAFYPLKNSDPNFVPFPRSSLGV